jgi:hypothetical protein
MGCRFVNKIERWTTIPHGGRFTISDETYLLASDFQEFFRSVGRMELKVES